MTLREAQKIAEATAALLEPHCERIEIAGSVRRGSPVCNDVDLVVIPKTKPICDLVGEIGRQNLVHSVLVEYVDSRKAQWIRGVAPKPEGEFFSLRGAKCQLDVFMATPATFVTRLITRTGSKEHNVWISERMQACGGAFRPQEGLLLPGKGLYQPESEAAFYEAMGLPFIQPRDRELPFLKRLEREVACQ